MATRHDQLSSSAYLCAEELVRGTDGSLLQVLAVSFVVQLCCLNSSSTTRGNDDLIKEPTTLTEVRLSWAGVEALRNSLQVSAFASRGVIGGSFPFKLANAAHNLPFVHAFAVLNDVLEQLANEGHFVCKSIFLGALLQKSKNALPWRAYGLISAGVERRNDVAHRGQLLERGECWKYIDAVSDELTGWGII
jgi:hypothetical protein